MKYTKFTIQNFKGINRLEVDLSKFKGRKIFPLVGLNEAGKTTILEALNLIQHRWDEGREDEMIHKEKQGDFNDQIVIQAELSLEESDLNLIDDFLLKNKLEKERDITSIYIKNIYKFENSKLTPNGYNTKIDIPLLVKTRTRSSFVLMDTHYKEKYDDLLDQIKGRIPKILYFDNFLFDFPDKIYLQANKASVTDTILQREYRERVQDILSSLGKNYTLKKHILDRLLTEEDADRRAAQKVLNEMNKKLNKEILNPWKEVFGDKSSNKKIVVKYSNDPNGYYLEFEIEEGANSFNIGERSLGFRWFFGFLLFTEFRKARKTEYGEYLFLFDEPANNLHQKSQQKLLELFEKLSDRAKIIYSTHSHYMLNPKLALTSFVVVDEGKKEDENGNIDWDNYSQDIHATPYHIYVSKSDVNDKTHFQPILDCLEFIPNPFEKVNDIVFLEGKNDYYTFKWVMDNYFLDRYSFNFYPGGSASKYENIFAEYLAHNRNFIAIFDDDPAGKSEKNRYIENVSIELKDKIFTLGDIKQSFAGKETENLFFSSKKTNEKLNIQTIYRPDLSQYKKKAFNAAIQALFAEGKKISLKKTTLNNFEVIFDFIQDKLDNLDN